MKNAVGKIVTIVIVLAVAYWIVSGVLSRRQTQAQRRAAKVEEQAEKRVQIKKSLEDMVVKYNAATEWHRDFDFDQENAGLFGPPIYTIQIEDALVRADKRPVMFVAHVEDVVKGETEYSVHFSTADPFGIFLSRPSIRFILHCTHDQVNLIMQNPRDAGLFERENYAVIAEISGVRKVSLALTAHADSVVPEDEYSFEVDISTNLEPSNIFVSFGRCLDLLFVGDYELSNSQEATPE